ncbi:13884_t:CDS:2 [Ambispora leptoticha]|uniref:13884_t:CDS:1 n=1 Tax=Ambispora leptoticha TaxID=144679 RepID=A0A9N9DD00_9GLOM|nr:13884_t:CDS:2 [Ambispora leptoticha]
MPSQFLQLHNSRFRLDLPYLNQPSTNIAALQSYMTNFNGNRGVYEKSLKITATELKPTPKSLIVILTTDEMERIRTFEVFIKNIPETELGESSKICYNRF